MARLSTLLPLGLIVGSVVAVLVLVLGSEGLPRLRVLRSELQYVERSNVEIRREIEELRYEIRALRSDPAEIERVARDELGMLRPDETIFQFNGREARAKAGEGR